MTGSLPASLSDVSPDWLNTTVFGATPTAQITGLSFKLVGDGRGFLSQTALFDLEFATQPGPDQPTRIIVKMLPSNEEFREAEGELKGFLREVNFYRSIAPNVNLRLPTIYFAEQSDEGAIIVMEDLSRLKGGDQVRGLTHEQVLATARRIARVHAAYWNSPMLDTLDWAPNEDTFHVPTMKTGWGAFVEEYGTRIGPEGRRIGQMVADNIDRLEQVIATRPQTIIHGDLRADNILLGAPGTDEDVLILDWQLVARSLATIDVARMVGASEPVAERRGHCFDALQVWHDELTRNGVTDYTLDDATVDFRLAALHLLTVPVKLHDISGHSQDMRAALLREAMSRRYFAFAEEIDVTAVFERLQD